MLPKDGIILNTLTPKIKLAYADIKLVSESEYCQSFDALSRSDNQKYTIRTLNVTSEFYKEHPNLATTLFLQELLRLCAKFPEAVVIESFESHEKGLFAYAIRHCQNLQQLMEKDKAEAVSEVNYEVLLRDILLDIKFLLSNLRISSTIRIELQSIYKLSGIDGYFLSDWAKNLEKDSKSDMKSVMNGISDGTNEVYNLGFKILELYGIPREDLEDVAAVRSPKLYNGNIDNMLADLKLPENFKITMRKMLSKDSESRPKLNNLIQERENEPMGVLDEEKQEIKEKTEEKSLNILTITRFEKIHSTKTIDYGYLSLSSHKDGIAMVVSKSILLLGIGLYVPISQDNGIKGTIGVYNGGAHNPWASLISEDVLITSNSPNAVDKIFQVMFGKPVIIQAEAKYTIRLDFRASLFFEPVSCYMGTGGKSLVKGDGDVQVTFTTAFAAADHRSTSSVAEGQIPEIYYSLIN